MTGMDAATLRRALRDADPALSRFDPLPRIVFCDDFDRGFCGWTQLLAASALLRNYLSDVSEGLRWNYLWNLDGSGFVLDTFRCLEERYLEALLADMGFRRACGLLAVLD